MANGHRNAGGGNLVQSASKLMATDNKVNEAWLPGPGQNQQGRPKRSGHARADGHVVLIAIPMPFPSQATSSISHPAADPGVLMPSLVIGKMKNL